MGLFSSYSRRFVLCAAGLLSALVGCTGQTPQQAENLAKYRSILDLSGLARPEVVDVLKVSIARPENWDPAALQKNPLYTHQQWRSPSRHTAAGVCYIRMPLPLNASTVANLGMKEYAKRSNDGKLIRRWSDPFGREWFEAENDKYHVYGYVITKGFDAWVNYCGFRTHEGVELAELSLGIRCMESILPASLAKKIDAAQPAPPPSSDGR